MRWFYNLSFRSKLLVPIGLIIFATLVITALNLASVTAMNAETRTITRTYLPAVQLVLEADRDLHQALIAERALLMEEAGSESFRRYQTARADNVEQVRERMAQVAELDKDPQVDRLIDQFSDQFARWEALSGSVARTAAQDIERSRTLSFGDAEAGFDTVRKTMDELTELLHHAASASGTSVEQRAAAAHYSQVLGNGAILALLVLVALFLPPLVTRPLSAIRDRVEDIARGEGDLTQRIDISTRDELGQLARSFNAFMDKLQKIIGDVGSYTREVAAASQQLSSISDDNNRLVTQQHDTVDMVVTAANEMSTAIQDVARSTADAATESQSADSHSSAGKRQVQQTIGAMTGLREGIQDAGEVIARLAEDATQIAAVLDVIRGIAEQTNLLALNAAIEAARAGEQGRGFAVVADEVRTLASRTQQSTRDIEGTIDRLQGGVARAVEAMSAGSRKADQTLAEARETETMLGAIAQSVQRINGMSMQIASATEEQSAVTEDINRNMISIGDQSRQVASGAGQTATASAELARLASQLQKTVGQFRV